jgi:hypothetical protein
MKLHRLRRRGVDRLNTGASVMEMKRSIMLVLRHSNGLNKLVIKAFRSLSIMKRV